MFIKKVCQGKIKKNQKNEKSLIEDVEIMANCLFIKPNETGIGYRIKLEGDNIFTI
jgi:hypothetical protein